MISNMDEIKLLAQAYRNYIVALGQEFTRVKEGELYAGFADTFIDAVKSPEIGFTPAEVNHLMAIAKKFELLEPNELPSHHSMKLMANKPVDMDLLESAQTLSVTDFRELVKDKETGTQDRTYKYEIIKRVVETGNIKRVYGEELQEALKQINNEPG